MGGKGRRTCLDGNEPGGHGLVNERSVGAPAERVGVGVGGFVHLCEVGGWVVD